MTEMLNKTMLDSWRKYWAPTTTIYQTRHRRSAEVLMPQLKRLARWLQNWLTWQFLRGLGCRCLGCRCFNFPALPDLLSSNFAGYLRKCHG